VDCPFRKGRGRRGAVGAGAERLVAGRLGGPDRVVGPGRGSSSTAGAAVNQRAAGATPLPPTRPRRLPLTRTGRSRRGTCFTWNIAGCGPETTTGCRGVGPARRPKFAALASSPLAGPPHSRGHHPPAVPSTGSLASTTARRSPGQPARVARRAGSVSRETPLGPLRALSRLGPSTSDEQAVPRETTPSEERIHPPLEARPRQRRPRPTLCGAYSPHHRRSPLTLKPNPARPTVSGPPSAAHHPCGPPSAAHHPCGPPSAAHHPCGPPPAAHHPCGPPPPAHRPDRQATRPHLRPVPATTRASEDAPDRPPTVGPHPSPRVRRSAGPPAESGSPPTGRTPLSRPPPESRAPPSGGRPSHGAERHSSTHSPSGTEHAAHARRPAHLHPDGARHIRQPNARHGSHLAAPHQSLLHAEPHPIDLVQPDRRPQLHDHTSPAQRSPPHQALSRSYYRSRAPAGVASHPA